MSSGRGRVALIVLDGVGIGATVAEYFDIRVEAGQSFLREVAPWATD